ncbi:MAG TPA: AsmA family protein, partial [Cyclobacteriaceae bacterium]|nr:AsmA family protein [Cyclobacteriaceae bacterium]
MKKLAKITLWIVASVMLIALTAYGVAVSYKKEMLSVINEKIGESINGTVQINDFSITLFHDFPNISLSLKGISLRGPQHEKYKHDFLSAGVIDLNVEAMKLLHKQVNIKSIDVLNGDVFIFRTKDGYLNLDIFKKQNKKDTTSLSNNVSISFEKINFRNVRLAFHDSLKEKLFGATFVRTENRIISKDTSLHAHIAGDIDFEQITFNLSKGSFLENKHAVANISLEFFFPSKRLVIEPSMLKLEKSLINLSGAMKFLPQGGGDFQIKIQSDKVDFEEGLAVITQSMRNSLSKFSIERPVAIQVNLNGQLGSAKPPATDGKFTIRDSHISWSVYELKNSFVQGSFTNHKDDLLWFDDANTEIKLDSLQGVLKNLPFK